MPVTRFIVSSYMYGKVLPVSTDCVTKPPKANMARRPFAALHRSSSSFFGSDAKPSGSKP